MKQLKLEFCAFIPKSLGNPMSFYINDNPGMSNREEFNGRIKGIQGTWLPEPGTGIFGLYFKTDERDFGGGSSRLKSTSLIDLSQVGKFDESKKNVFSHLCDASHRLQVQLITTVKGTFFGSLQGPSQKTSTSPQDVDKIKNDVFGTYFTAPGTPRSALIDGTSIETSASAGYPFMEPLSPNIDYSFTVILHKMSANIIKVKVSGEHNCFPFYELLANDIVKYKYDAKSNGQTGPNPINLNQSKDFSVEWMESI